MTGVLFSGDVESDDGPQMIPGMVVAGSPDEMGVGNQMNSTVYMSVNHYNCAAEGIEDQGLILYGTKSWTFPIQDVNLTLSYPTVNSDPEPSSEEKGYIVTEFKVVLYIDGMETKGYIMDGGVLEESLVLSFVSRSITSLSYEFWVYGSPKHDLASSAHSDIKSKHFICA